MNSEKEWSEKHKKMLIKQIENKAKDEISSEVIDSIIDLIQSEEEIQSEEQIQSTEQIQIEENELYLIKNRPNEIWEKYQQNIKKVTSGLAYWKNFDGDELFQQSYIYFVDLCKNYQPFYCGNHIPFDKFLFKNLIIKLRAFIQGYYFKRKREAPTEFSESSKKKFNPQYDLEFDKNIFTDYIYSLLNNRQKEIIELSVKGYKQQEIGKILDISQSRVSVIKKKTIKKLKDILKNE